MLIELTEWHAGSEPTLPVHLVPVPHLQKLCLRLKELGPSSCHRKNVQEFQSDIEKRK